MLSLGPTRERVGFRSLRVIYAAGGEQGRGHLYQLNPVTGAPTWENHADDIQSTFLAPTISGETAYTGGFYGNVHAVDTTDGSTRWRVETDMAGGHRNPPVVADDRVFVLQNARTLKAIDAVSGEPTWEYETDNALTGDIVAADNKVYASDETTVYAIDAEAGRVRQRYTGDAIYWTSTTNGSHVFVGEWGVWAIDAAPDASGERPALPAKSGQATILGDWQSGVFVVQ